MTVRSLLPQESTTTGTPPTLDAGPGSAHGSRLPEWLVVVDHVIDRLPAVSAQLGPIKGSLGAHVAMLWVVVAAIVVGGAYHLVGDGTVRARASRTECLVEWLVERAVAEDRGQPPPPFSPLACSE